MALLLQGYSPSWMGKAQQEEHAAVGHVVSTIREQREVNAGAQLAFSSSVQDPAHGMALPTSGVHIPSSAKALCELSQRHVQRWVSRSSQVDS